MRTHGVPHWPDPSPQGQFATGPDTLGPDIQKASILAAQRACARLGLGLQPH